MRRRPMTRRTILARMLTASQAGETLTLTSEECGMLLSLRPAKRETEPVSWMPSVLQRARELATTGHTAAEIGLALGCSATAVQHAMSRFPPSLLECHQAYRLTLGETVAGLRLKGAGWSRIASTLGVSEYTVRTYLAAYRATLQAQAAK
jgi:hypothetical protein